MDCDEPDLEAFESNLGEIIRARDSGKTPALVSNLSPNSSDPRSIGVSCKDNPQLWRDPLWGRSSFRQSDSDDLLNDPEKSAEWKFGGHLRFAACRWSAGETYEKAVLAAVDEQYLPTVPVPVHHVEILPAESDRELLKLPIRGFGGYVQAKSASRRQWRKRIGAASLKIQGGIPLHKM